MRHALANPQVIDEILSFQQGGSTYYPITDALGSIYAITNSTGVVVSTFSYDVFGKRTQTSGILAIDFGFTGRQHVSDTGHIDNRDRARDPSTGAWLQPDRAGMADGPNQYLFVKAKPTMLTDPSGRKHKGTPARGCGVCTLQPDAEEYWELEAENGDTKHHMARIIFAEGSADGNGTKVGI